jgi:hypothetical protein
MQKNSNEAASPSVISKREIQQLLQESFDREEPLVFSPSGTATSFFCLIRDLNENEVVIRNPIKPSTAHAVVASDKFFIFCRSYKIEAMRFSPRGQDFVFQIPDQAILSQERTKKRSYYSDRDEAHVLITHPFDTGTEIRRKLIDASEGGLSFRAKEMTSFVQKGRVLPKIRIFIRNELTAERAGMIVYAAKIVDHHGDSYHQVGVQFSDTAPVVDKS